jgi:hypothetical protein
MKTLLNFARKFALKFAPVLLLVVPFAAAQTAPAAPSVQDKAVVRQAKTSEHDATQKPGATLRQNARIEDSAEAPQVRFVAFQANRQDEKSAPTYVAGNSLGNELGGAVSRSIQVHRFHAYVKKTCRRYGSGTSWIWMFSNGETVEGTCN